MESTNSNISSAETHLAGINLGTTTNAKTTLVGPYKNPALNTTYIFGTNNSSLTTIYSTTWNNPVSWRPISPIQTTHPFPNGITLGLAGAINTTLVATGYEKTSSKCLKYSIDPTFLNTWFDPTWSSTTPSPIRTRGPFFGGQGNGVTFYTPPGQPLPPPLRDTQIRYIACGYDTTNTHTIICSPNGQTWSISYTTAKTIPFSDGYAKAVACNGILWVAVGKGTSSIVYCAYGKTAETSAWYTLKSTDPFLLGKACDVKWNKEGKYWLVGGEGPSTIAFCNTVPKNSTWSPVWTTIDNPFKGGVVQSLCWNGVYWVAVGFNYDFTQYKSICITTSKDGKTWTVNTSNDFYTMGGVLSSVDWNQSGQFWITVGTTNDGTYTALRTPGSDPTQPWTSLITPLSYGYGLTCTIGRVTLSTLALNEDEEETESTSIPEQEPIKSEALFHTEPPTSADYAIINNKYNLEFDVVDKWICINCEIRPKAYFGVIDSNDIAKFWITGLDYYKAKLNIDISGFKIDFGSGDPITLVNEGNYYTAVVNLKLVGDTIIGFSKKIQYSIRVRNMTILLCKADTSEPLFTNKSYDEITLSSCLLFGTLIKTVGGYIPIQTLQVNDTVCNHKDEPVKIVKILRMAEKYERRPKIKNKIMYKIDINTYGARKPIYISRHHRIMTSEGVFVKAHEANLNLAPKNEFVNKNNMYYLYNLQLENHTTNHLVINGGTIVECWDGVLENPVYIAKELQSQNVIRYLRNSPII